MITPTFKLSQTPTHLTATIHCPNISVRLLLLLPPFPALVG